MPPDKPAPRQACFVDMPFGKKTDPKSELEIDFDQIYTMGIEPAVVRAGLELVPPHATVRRGSRWRDLLNHRER
jgi:hypothetical protein